MKKIKFIIVNDTSSPSPTPASLGSIASDFRHSLVIDSSYWLQTSGSTNRALGSAAWLDQEPFTINHEPSEALIRVLLLARRHYPKAKILGLSEIIPETRNMKPETHEHITPSDSMNKLRRELSDLP